MRARIISLIILMLFLFTGISTAQRAFNHPGLSHKKSDLDRMKYQVEAKLDPWYASYQEMCSYSTASYDYTVKGHTGLTVIYRDSPATNKNIFESDSRAAYYNALRWYIEGDERYARKAVECLNAWTGLTYVQERGTAALTSNMIIIMLEAAEIIKSTYPGWTEAEIQKFKDMLVYPGYSDTQVPTTLSWVGTWYWRAYMFDAMRAGNQELCGIRTTMAMGIFLDNHKMYDRAWRYVTKQPGRTDDIPGPAGPHKRTGIKDGDNPYRIDYSVVAYDDEPNFYGNGALTNYVFENGQCQESSRDQGHTGFGLGLLCSVAEIAWNQGDDLWGHTDDRILLGLEYSMKYNVSFVESFADQPEPWEPTVASGEFMEVDDATLRTRSLKICPYIDTDTTRLTRGKFPTTYIWELPIAHYVGRGYKAENEALWTTRARDYAISANGKYEAASTGGDFVGLGGMSFRRPDGCYGDPILGFSDDGLPEYGMNLVPGTINLANFDHSSFHGEGRTYHDTDTVNTGHIYRIDEGVDIDTCSEGGYCLTELENGEWLTYTLYVPRSGLYNISLRYASANANGKMKLSAGGVDIGDELTVPFGEGYSTGLDNWMDLQVAEDYILTKGVQALKVWISGESNAFKLKEISIEQGTDHSCDNGLPPVSTVSYIEPGIYYAYYEGSFDSIPDYATLEATEEGFTDSIKLLPHLSADSFAMEFSGFIDIPIDGSYTFYIQSDEGSRLHIDGNLIVDNNGLLAGTEESGSICLDEGFHEIKVEYFEQTGEVGLWVMFEGPGTGKRALANLYAAGDCENQAVQLPEGTSSGINYYYYEGDWGMLPDFTELSPKDWGTINGIGIGSAQQADYYAFVFEGYFEVAEDGEYTFYTSSDDGSALYINEQKIVNNDGTHGVVESAGSLCLAKGYHQIRVEYFEKTGGASLSVQYEGEGISKRTLSGFVCVPFPAKLSQMVTFEDLPEMNVGDPDFTPLASASSGLPISFSSFHPNVASIVDNKIHIVGEGVAIIVATQEGNSEYKLAKTSKQLIVHPKGTSVEDLSADRVILYPNPVEDVFHIQRAEPDKARLEIFNTTGKLVHTQEIFGNKASVSTTGFTGGVYFVKIFNEQNVNTYRFIIK